MLQGIFYNGVVISSLLIRNMKSLCLVQNGLQFNTKLILLVQFGAAIILLWVKLIKNR